MSTVQQRDKVVEAFEYRKRTREDWAGAEWIDFFADEATGRDSRFTDRTNARVMLELAKEGDWIMVANFDRLVCGIQDACATMEYLKSRQIRLSILDFGGMEIDTNSAYGEFFFVLMAQIKKLELHDIRRRVRESVSHRKRLGMVVSGSAPLGWEVGWFRVGDSSNIKKFYLPDNRTRRLARQIMHIYDSGIAKAGFNGTARYCNAHNILLRGKPWSAKTLQKYVMAARRNFTLPGGAEPAKIPRDAVRIHKLDGIVTDTD
jgi:DNA invertase Pin-like site-specific DNA recombinase